MATLSNGYYPTGTISWNVYSTSDTWCSKPLNAAPLTVPVNGNGTYTSPGFVPSAPGGYQWVATYSGDRYNYSVSTRCGAQNETSSVSPAPPAKTQPVQVPPAPAISVVKLQRDGSSGAFTTGTISATVGSTIEYEVLVTNTGNVPVLLSLSDVQCGGAKIAGPTAVSGTLTGDALSPGGEVEYTCSHLLTSSDASPFVNTATVTALPPSGTPVVGTSTVIATKQSLKAKKILRCARGTIKTTRKVHGKTEIVCVKKTVKAVVITTRPTFTA